MPEIIVRSLANSNIVHTVYVPENAWLLCVTPWCNGVNLHFIADLENPGVFRRFVIYKCDDDVEQCLDDLMYIGTTHLLNNMDSVLHVFEIDPKE